MTRRFLAAVVVLLPLALAACGGGGEQAAQPTAVGQPTSAGTPTPMNTPVITDNLFEYQDKGYSVRFPEGWTALPDFVASSALSIDAFFGPQEIEGVKPNMTVTCERLPEGMTSKEYVDTRVTVAKAVTKVEPEISSRSISGQEATQLRYARQDIQTPVEKTDIFFTTDRCGWGISLTVPYNERDSYHEPFDQFVDSFRFLP